MTDTDTAPNPDGTTEYVLTYDELVNNRPQRFKVDRHQNFDETGIIVVSAPPGILGVSMHPGSQLNIKADRAGDPMAYSIGPDEHTVVDAGPSEGDESRFDDRAGPTTTSTTPAPQDATTGLTPAPQAASDIDTTPEAQEQSQADASRQADRDDDGVTVEPESVDADELEAREARLAELGDVDEWPHPKGGGWYVTSDGQQVQSKDEADRIQADLDGGGDS